MKCIVKWLLLMYMFICGQTQDDYSGLSSAALDDIFNIFNKRPIAVNYADIEVTPNNIRYYYFTSDKPFTYTVIDSNNTSEVSKNASIHVLIHGWIQDRTTSWYRDLKIALFNCNKNNVVIEVDYSTYAKQNYYAAYKDAPKVGVLIGKFITSMVNSSGIPLENFILIGHSLGGQIVGFVGKTVFQQLNTKLPRIVALDPAGPLFQGRPLTQRLAPTDAEVVHVIHTDGGGFGFFTNCGTIDFYPNGGSIQPGCFVKAGSVFCSHHRSWRYFIEAVNSTSHTEFKSQKCHSYLEYKSEKFLPLCDDEFEYMGSLTTTKQGEFYCNTNSASPFSKTCLSLD